MKIDFDEIWQKHSKYSRIEFACFSFHVGLKHANSTLESCEHVSQISSKSIFLISSYTVSKLVHFFLGQCTLVTVMTSGSLETKAQSANLCEQSCINNRVTNLDGNNNMAFISQEVVSIDSNNSCLVRLCNIGKNGVHHT